MVCSHSAAEQGVDILRDTLVPRIGAAIVTPGKYLLHSEADGNPHCFAVMVWSMEAPLLWLTCRSDRLTNVPLVCARR